VAWSEVTVEEQRREFVSIAGNEGSNVRELCRRYAISPTTGYKWLGRWAQGERLLEDRSRRRLTQPQRTAAEIEGQVLAVRDAHEMWGGRKIRKVLEREGVLELPSPSTITEILRRHGRLIPSTTYRGPFIRFERAAPNELWQMDFKGDVALFTGARCYPLTVLDDHSRFALAIRACANQQSTTVARQLRAIFRCYGLPQAMLMDNGSPWSGGPGYPFTRLTVWLIRLGITVAHGRPYHPQTQGKDERFHRTLKAEAIGSRVWRDLGSAQREFDRWRKVYNFERPHQALKLEVPATRYRASARSFPETLPAIEYGSDDQVRKVQRNGELYFRGRSVQVGKAFAGLPVALRPTAVDGRFAVFCCHQSIALIDLHRRA